MIPALAAIVAIYAVTRLLFLPTTMKTKGTMIACGVVCLVSIAVILVMLTDIFLHPGVLPGPSASSPDPAAWPGGPSDWPTN